jgi:predicted nicotinamide N-methyase
MSSDAARDLAAWIPRLVKVWRAQRQSQQQQSRDPRHQHGHQQRSRRPDPRDAMVSDTLTPHEIREVGAGVKQLSHGLTRERELAGARYMDNPRLLGAYLLFYWPVSYMQSRSALSELGRPRSVLDLGSGPGPLAFAAMDAGATSVIAADRSKPALELAKQLAIEAQESLGTREWSPEKPIPDGKFDLITMGHVVNELYNGDIAQRAQLLEKVLARLDKNGSLLVMEPALRDTTRALLKVRDVLVAQGYAVRAPCLFRGNCPALIKETDWCHADRPWKMPPLVEAIAGAAGLHKESLKMAYAVFAPKGEPWATLPEGRYFRIVSEALEGKGRQRFMGCGPEGRVGLAIQTKHETEKNRLFFKAVRGDVIKVDATEPRGDGLALTEASTVEIVANAGRPFPKPQ